MLTTACPWCSMLPSRGAEALPVVSHLARAALNSSLFAARAAFCMRGVFLQCEFQRSSASCRTAAYMRVGGTSRQTYAFDASPRVLSKGEGHGDACDMCSSMLVFSFAKASSLRPCVSRASLPPSCSGALPHGSVFRRTWRGRRRRRGKGKCLRLRGACASSSRAESGTPRQPQGRKRGPPGGPHFGPAVCAVLAARAGWC